VPDAEYLGFSGDFKDRVGLEHGHWISPVSVCFFYMQRSGYSPNEYFWIKGALIATNAIEGLTD
jgi:hypothetical protein